MKNRKTIVTSILLALMLALGLVMTSCGGPANLEELVNSDEELKAEIEALSQQGMTVDITGNTVTYTYKYDQIFDEATAAQVSSQLESAMDSMETTFTGVKDDLVEETGFSDIVIKIVYTDGNDTELYSAEY